MDIDTISAPLVCAVCEEELDETGYVPAIEGGEAAEPLLEDAVCGACGFSEVGMTGCAPALDEVDESGTGDVLLFVRRTDAGFEVVSTKP